jgi:hypothetical protein
VCHGQARNLLDRIGSVTRKERDGEVNRIGEGLNKLYEEDMAMLRVPLRCAFPLSGLDDWAEAGKKRDKKRQELRSKLRQLALQPFDD